MNQLFDWMKSVDNFTLFLIFIVVAYAVTYPFRAAVRMYIRYIRSKNIQAKGWPPPHLDADGDFKEKEEKEEDDE